MSESDKSSNMPNFFSQWFCSQSAEGKTGLKRRRSEIFEESYNHEDEHGSEPPLKRIKYDLPDQSSTTVLEEALTPITLLETRTTAATTWNRRPSFNGPVYGSKTLGLSGNRLLNAQSPFYNGQTIYGGASAYANHTSRVPTPGLLTSSSPSADKLNQLQENPTLLHDETEMGNKLSSSVPPVTQQNHAPEDQLNFNRSIRNNSVKSPYARPDPKVNKSGATEFQTPSVTQITKFQNQTEELRHLANNSKSILNTNKMLTDYKLAANVNKDSDDLLNGNSKKYVNKIKNKTFASEDERPAAVNLTNISFPAMKSIPQFNISPSSKSDTSDLLRSESCKFKFSSLNTSPSPGPPLFNSVNTKPNVSNAESSNDTKISTPSSAVSIFNLSEHRETTKPVDTFKFIVPKSKRNQKRVGDNESSRLMKINNNETIKKLVKPTKEVLNQRTDSASETPVPGSQSNINSQSIPLVPYKPAAADAAPVNDKSFKNLAEEQNEN